MRTRRPSACYTVTALVLVALGALATARAQDQAQEPDDYASCLYKFQDAYKAGEFSAAAQWCQRAAKAKPEEWNSYYYLGQSQFQLKLFESTTQSYTRALEVYKEGKGVQMIGADRLASIYGARAIVYLHLGEIAKGRLDIDEALKVNAKDPLAYRMMGEYLSNAGDFDKAIEAFTKSEQLFAEPNSYVRSIPELQLYGRGQARRQKGDYEGARGDFKKCIELGGKAAHYGHVGLALLSALADDAKVRDLKKAREVLDAGLGGQHSWIGVEGQGVLAAVEGDAEKALPFFAELGGLATSAETIYWHGVAQLKANARDRAVELLTRAADMRPAYRKRIETEAQFAPVRALVLAAVKELSGKKAEERIAVKQELDSAPLKLAYISGLVRLRKYKAALSNLEAFAKDVQSDALRKTAETRLKTIHDYDGLHGRLVAEIKKGGLKDVPLPTGDPANPSKVTDADQDSVDVVSGGGKANGPWAILNFDAYLELLRHMSTGEADWFTIGLLCLDNDRVARAEEAFCSALAKGKTFKAAIDEVIAAKRGIPVPPGGFVPSNGALVTAEESENLKKGLVQFRGQWVPKEDKPHLEKNHEKIGGKWVPLTEDQLEKRGFVKFDGEWRTKDEVSRLKGEWTNAWTQETEHYELRTNKSEEFAKKLAVALEDAYQAYGKFFGRSPPGGKKMKAFAFAKYDDYKAYCDKLGHPEKHNATGFAPSEPYTLCGYDKLGDDRSFTATMVHEGCHLFHQLSFPAAHPPSWVAEGMATYFEGFSFEEGGHLKWNYIARDRLVQVKGAIRTQTLPKMSDFLAGDAGALIASDTNKALVFYAEAWAVYYFLNQTLDGRYKNAFKTYQDTLDMGGQGDLKTALGPAWDSFEQDFTSFVQGM